MKIKSVKYEPILRQFYIYFLVASVIPLIILIYLLYQFAAAGKIDISGINSKFLIFIAGVFSVLGFWGTRSFLAKIVTLSNKIKETTWEKIDKDTLLELAKGEGEIAHLAKAFGEIATKLEENVRQLEDAKKMLYRILSKVGKAISSTENFAALIQFILETIMEALGAERGAIFSLVENKSAVNAEFILSKIEGLTI